MNILKLDSPLKTKTKMIGVFLEPELFEFLNRACFDEQKSRNYKINEIVKDYKVKMSSMAN